MLPNPKDIEHCLQEAAWQGTPLDGEVLRTVLILNTITEEYEAFALVSRGGASLPATVCL